MSAAVLTSSVARRRHVRRQRARRVFVNVAATVVFVAMAFPIYWMINSAFAASADVNSPTPRWFPSHPNFASFSRALHTPFFLRSVANSVIVVGSTVVISLALAFFAAVAVARFEFRARKSFLIMIIMVQMIPLNAMIIPLFVLLKDAGRLPLEASGYLDSIISNAGAGRWQPAAQTLYDFIRAQRRDGAHEHPRKERSLANWGKK